MLLALALTIAALSLAQSPAESEFVRGRVIDAVTAEPLALADIRQIGPALNSVRSDREGRFELRISSAGERRLRATLVGYRPLPVALPAAGAEIEIALQPDTLRQSDSVEVKAGPFSGPAAVCRGAGGQ